MIVDLVDVTEIADRFGKSEFTIRKYAQDGILPEPSWRASGNRPVWDGALIDKWADLRGWPRKGSKE